MCREYSSNSVNTITATYAGYIGIYARRAYNNVYNNQQHTELTVNLVASV